MTSKTRGILVAVLMSLTLVAGIAARVGITPPEQPEPGEDGARSVRSGAVRLTATPDRRSVLAGGDGIVRVELRLGADASAQPDSPELTPTDLVVILDRSGSMQGEPLAFAKAAIFELLEQLGSEDRFGLVTYASGGEVAIALESAGNAERSRWRRVVDDIRANGGTHMARGLDLAHELVGSAGGQGRSPRVILLSDGHANQGDHSIDGLRARAARAVAAEYVLSSVGVSQGFDENVMSTVADAGTGNFYYLPSLHELAGVFADEFASARERVASALELWLRPGDGVTVVDAAGLPLERAADGVRFRPGDLFAGQERRLWLTLRAPTNRPGELPLAQLSLGFTDLEGERRDLRFGHLPKIACVEAERDFYASFAPRTYRLGSSSEAIGALKQKAAAYMKAGRQGDAVTAVEEHLAAMKEEQRKALGYVVSEDAESLERLRDTLAAPAAAEPERQNALGKQLLEEGRDARRVGSKRK